MKLNRDKSITEHILNYCIDIENTLAASANDFKVFSENKIYQSALAFCLLQIGELVGKYTDEFKEKYNAMPWQAIKGMRNLVAHDYGHVDISKVWETAVYDIPELEEYCIEILQELRTS